MAKQSRISKRLTASVSMSSDMVYDLYCEACSEDDNHLEAEGYCVDCNDYLCMECVKGHRRTQMSRKHVLQDKTQMPQHKPSQSVAVPSTGTITEKCSRHPDRLVEYYCRDDRSLGCSVCMTVNHRLCNSVDHIPDLTEQLVDSQEYKKFTNTLNTLKTKSQNVVKRTKENVNKADKWFSDAANTLQELRGKMNKAFDKFEVDLKNKANTIKSADLKIMQDISDKGQTVLKGVKTISAKLQSLENQNQLGQLFIYMIQLDDEVETLHKLLAEADTCNSVTSYTFETGSHVQKLLNNPSSIGTLSVQAPVRPKLAPSTTPPALKKTSAQSPASQSASRPATPVSPSSTTPVQKKTSVLPHSAHPAAPLAMYPQNMKAALLEDIDVRTKSDTCYCWITGSVLLPGNKLLLIDRNNSKVKLLNLQTTKVTSELTTSATPWDTTSITPDQLAVTLPDKRQIVFVKVTDTLKIIREMSVAGECRAILHNNGTLIVAFSDPVKIEIMALDGTVERKIEQPGLFEWPSHMTLSPDCKAMYVSDSDGDCVKRMTLDGDVEAVYSDNHRYRDKELNDVRGLTVDQHGRVLVCGTRSRNVHLLTSDLTMVKVLVDGLHYPQSLSYCHDTGRLFVGMESDKVNVYQLS